MNLKKRTFTLAIGLMLSSSAIFGADESIFALPGGKPISIFSPEFAADLRGLRKTGLNLYVDKQFPAKMQEIEALSATLQNGYSLTFNQWNKKIGALEKLLMVDLCDANGRRQADPAESNKILQKAIQFAVLKNRTRIGFSDERDYGYLGSRSTKKIYEVEGLDTWCANLWAEVEKKQDKANNQDYLTKLIAAWMFVDYDNLYKSYLTKSGLEVKTARLLSVFKQLAGDKTKYFKPSSMYDNAAFKSATFDDQTKFSKAVATLLHILIPEESLAETELQEVDSRILLEKLGVRIEETLKKLRPLHEISGFVRSKFPPDQLERWERMFPDSFQLFLDTPMDSLEIEALVKSLLAIGNSRATKKSSNLSIQALKPRQDDEFGGRYILFEENQINLIQPDLQAQEKLPIEPNKGQVINKFDLSQMDELKQKVEFEEGNSPVQIVIVDSDTKEKPKYPNLLAIDPHHEKVKNNIIKYLGGIPLPIERCDPNIEGLGKLIEKAQKNPHQAFVIVLPLEFGNPKDFIEIYRYLKYLLCIPNVVLHISLDNHSYDLQNPNKFRETNTFKFFEGLYNEYGHEKFNRTIQGKVYFAGNVSEKKLNLAKEVQNVAIIDNELQSQLVTKQEAEQDPLLGALAKISYVGSGENEGKTGTSFVAPIGAAQHALAILLMMDKEGKIGDKYQGIFTAMQSTYEKKTLMLTCRQNGELTYQTVNNMYSHTLGVMNFRRFVGGFLYKKSEETISTMVVFGHKLLQIASQLGITLSPEQSFAKIQEMHQHYGDHPEILQLNSSRQDIKAALWGLATQQLMPENSVGQKILNRPVA